MIKFGDIAEIEAYAYGWELRVYRDKLPTHQHPNPKGKTCIKSWHGTLEQACKALLDRKLAEIDADGMVLLVEAIKQTGREIVTASSKKVPV